MYYEITKKFWQPVLKMHQITIYSFITTGYHPCPIWIRIRHFLLTLRSFLFIYLRIFRYMSGITDNLLLSSRLNSHIFIFKYKWAKLHFFCQLQLHIFLWQIGLLYQIKMVLSLSMGVFANVYSSQLQLMVYEDSFNLEYAGFG